MIIMYTSTMYYIGAVYRCHSDAVLNGLNFLCEVLCDSRDVNSQGMHIRIHYRFRDFENLYSV